ncbi:MAG TPA: hypothetical protein PLU58_07350 [Saprospiraceae bacterium]|nr:hypothetical protein [Saprospiraceae bacterium]
MSALKTILLDGVIERVSSRKDKSISIHFATQEIQSDKAGDVMSLVGQYVKSVFTNKDAIPYEVVEAVESTELQDTKKPRTHSQRLRAKIWARWKSENTGADKDSFEKYYHNYMEKLISQV